MVDMDTSYVSAERFLWLRFCAVVNALWVGQIISQVSAAASFRIPERLELICFLQQVQQPRVVACDTFWPENTDIDALCGLVHVFSSAHIPFEVGICEDLISRRAFSNSILMVLTVRVARDTHVVLSRPVTADL